VSTPPIVHAILVAAGSGHRFGGSEPKQLTTLGEHTVLEHALEAIVGSGAVDAVVVVTRLDLVDRVKDLCSGSPSVAAIVAGGATRAESVRAGLAAIAGEPADLVLVHDAARPLVASDQVAEVVSALADADAATVAIPADDTLLRVETDTVVGTLERSGVFRAQTPQGFRLGTLRDAHDRAMRDPDFVATDDCSIILRYLPNATVKVVAGSRRNIKITTLPDLATAARLLGDI